jgi:hypothetical protein
MLHPTQLAKDACGTTNVLQMLTSTDQSVQTVQ